MFTICKVQHTATETFVLTDNQELIIFDIANAVEAEHSNGYQIDIAELWIEAAALAGRFTEAEVVELEEMGLIEIARGMSGTATDVRLTVDGAIFYDRVISKLW